MVQWVNACFTNMRCELDPQHLCKNWGVAASFCNSSAGQMDTAGLSVLTSLFSQLVRLSEGTKKRGVIEDDAHFDFWPPCMHVRT